jgi:hypothetical protein
MNINDESPKSNDDILYAIRKNLSSKGLEPKNITKIIRNMSDEDLTCYYEENCK